MLVSQNSVFNRLIYVIVVVFALFQLKAFIVPLLFAFVLAIAIYPLVEFFEVRWRFSSVLSVSMAVLVLTAILTIIISLVLIELTDVMDKGDTYIGKLMEMFNHLEKMIVKKIGIKYRTRARVFTMAEFEAMITGNVNAISDVLTFSTGLIADLMIVPLYVFFILYYRRFLMGFLEMAFERSDHYRLKNIILGIFDVVQNYLKGLVIVMIIVGVCNSVGLLILGIENAIFFGFLGGMLMLFPYIGITIGSILPALVALSTKPSPLYAIAVLALFFGIQMIEGNFITPKITGSKVSVNAFVAILSFVLFGMLWGLPGLMLALPLTASIKVYFDHTRGLEHYGYLIGEPGKEHFSRSDSPMLKLFFGKSKKRGM